MTEPVISPSSTVQQDSISGLPTPQKSTGNAGWTAEQTLPPGADGPNDVQKVHRRTTSTRISSATTTTMTGAKFLHRIIIEGGTSGLVTVYNNTAGSGTKISEFTPTITGVLPFDIDFGDRDLDGNGVTVVTAAATNLVVVWS